MTQKDPWEVKAASLQRAARKAWKHSKEPGTLLEENLKRQQAAREADERLRVHRLNRWTQDAALS